MFKRMTLPIASALAMLLMAGSAQAALLELVDNGGFETGDFTGWTQFNPGTQSITGVNPSSGSFAANADCSTPTGAPCDSLLKSANKGIGVVTPGQAITISFDYRGTTGPGGVIFAELFSELDGGGVSKTELLGGGPLFPNANPDVWTTAVFNTFLGPDVAGGVTLQLKSSCGAVVGCVADIFFDNASMSVVPVPAAVWLFGSALGLLGWMRRKAS